MCSHPDLYADREGDDIVTYCTRCYETVAVESIDELLRACDQVEYQPAADAA